MLRKMAYFTALLHSATHLLQYHVSDSLKKGDFTPISILSHHSRTSLDPPPTLTVWSLSLCSFKSEMSRDAGSTHPQRILSKSQKRRKRRSQRTFLSGCKQLCEISRRKLVLRNLTRKGKETFGAGWTNCAAHVTGRRGKS